MMENEIPLLNDWLVIHLHVAGDDEKPGLNPHQKSKIFSKIILFKHFGRPFGMEHERKNYTLRSVV